MIKIDQGQASHDAAACCGLSSVGYQRFWDLERTRRALVQYQLASMSLMDCERFVPAGEEWWASCTITNHCHMRDFRILVNAGPGFCYFLFLQLQPDL